MTTPGIIEAQWAQHKAALILGLQQLDWHDFRNAADLLLGAAEYGSPVFVAGNGASAALSQHWACDHLKGASGELISYNVISLASNMALMTAIGNDLGYERVFTEQLKHHTRKHSEGVVVLISASGKSPNVVHTANFVKNERPKLRLISLTGFLGEPLRSLSDVNFHVKLTEYEAVEDVHGAIMHTLAKYLRTMTR
jgi:phosphoheptose isomerase